MTDILERLREYQDHVPYDVAEWLNPLQADAADEIERLRPILEAAKLYAAWAVATGDYPHDQEGCVAHRAILDAVRGYEKAPQ